MANFRVSVISFAMEFLLLSFLLLAVHAAPDSDVGIWDKDPCDAYSCTCMKEDASGECININCCQCKSEDADGVCAKVICGECIGDGCAECITPRKVDTPSTPSGTPSKVPSTTPSTTPSGTPSKTPSKTPSNAPTPQPILPLPFEFEYIGDGHCITHDNQSFPDMTFDANKNPDQEFTLEGCKNMCRSYKDLYLVVGIEFEPGRPPYSPFCRCKFEPGSITSATSGQGNCPTNALNCQFHSDADAGDVVQKTTGLPAGDPGLQTRYRGPNCYKNVG